MSLKLSYKLLLLLPIYCFVSCSNYPKDTYKTFEQVKNDTLLVGYAVNPPWVLETEQEPSGIEVEIVKGFAESINAEIKWVKQNEQSLLEELENRNLHLVISGLTNLTPWKNRIAMSSGYITHNSQKHVLAASPGEHRFMYELENYLYKNSNLIKELLNNFENQNSTQ